MEILLDLTVRAIERGPVEIVDFPNKNGDVPSFCESLPEGISTLSGWWYTQRVDIWALDLLTYARDFPAPIHFCLPK